MKRFIMPILLILVSIACAGLFIFFAAKNQITTLDGILLQFICLGLGYWGSLIFGQNSASHIQKPHIRSAFRRLYTLYGSMFRVKGAIQNKDSGVISDSETFVCIDAIVTEQLVAMGDALEDWNEILPDTIRELREECKRRNQHDG